MADSFLTLANLVLINDQNLADVEITDLLDDAPLIAALAADTASNGTNHKYVKATGAPTVGVREVNTGRENSKSTDTLVEISLKLLDASFAVDQGLARPYKKGPEAYIQRELRRHLKAAFAAAEGQLLYGSDADGFDGLIDATTLDALADVLHVVNATGSSAGTGSSVFAIRTNNAGTDCQVITNEDGQIVVGETIEQAIEDVANGGRFPAYFTPVMGWLALQIGGVHSVKRLCNLTAETGKGLTDDLLADLLALFPAARQPNILAMNRRSLKQLQQSRTATNSTGAPAPFPTEAFGIPITVTDQIVSTETIVT
jgi:hypothetical protein